MKVGIVGNGVVGQATARCYMEYAEVMAWDIMKERTTHPLKDVLECDLVFVCLPTLPDFPTRHIREFLNHHMVEGVDPRKVNWVLRSTVPPGTTRKLQADYHLESIVHSPEFLTARCSFTDAMLPSRNIVGVPNLDHVNLNQAYLNLRMLWLERFPGVAVHVMTSDESEAVKLILNSFFAVKVAFFNEVNKFATDSNMNWPAVLEGVLSDGRVGHTHTKVPGPDGRFGFGGACLPKDLRMLAKAINETGSSTPYICEAAATRNIDDRDRDVDTWA